MEESVTRQDTKTRSLIKNFVTEKLLKGNEASIQDDTSFIEDGIIDSMGVLELVAFIEETFLTALRTGIASAIASKYLARKDFFSIS